MTPTVKKLVAVFCAIALICAAATAPARAATPEQVDEAIKKAIAYLYAAQLKDGTWEPGGVAANNHVYGGYTAIATYALLAAGESPQDQRLKPAIDWLLQAQMNGTYAVAQRLEPDSQDAGSEEGHRPRLRPAARRAWGGRLL